MIVAQAVIPQAPVEGSIKLGGSFGTKAETFKLAFSQLLNTTTSLAEQSGTDLQLLPEELQQMFLALLGVSTEDHLTQGKEVEVEEGQDLQGLLHEPSQHEELGHYLNQLAQMIAVLNQSSVNAGGTPISQQEQLEQLYIMFQKLPLTVGESGQIVSQRTDSIVMDTEASANLAKWNDLLHALFNTKQKGANAQQAALDGQDAKLMQQVKRIAVELNQNIDWKKFIADKLKQNESATSIQSTFKPENAESLLRTPSYLPASMLKQWNEGRSVTSVVQQDAATTGVLHVSSVNLPSDSGINTLLQQANQTETTASKSGEASQPTVRFSHLMEDIQSIMKQQLQLKQAQEGSQIHLKLYPEHLGHLDIRITSVEGKIYAQLMTSNQMAKEALELTVGQLRVALQQQGLQVDRIEITQQQQQSLSQSSQDQRDGQAFYQQQNQRKNPSHNDLNQDAVSVEDFNLVTDELDEGIDFKA